MTDLRTAAQQALKAWQVATYGHPSHHKATLLAMTALRAALAQEEQEPTVRFKCTVVDDQHPNGVPFEQWVNAPQQEPVTQMRGNALARWAHEQEEPPDTGWQRDWQRGYETARRWVRQVGLPSLAQQEAPKGGGNLPPPLQAEPAQEPVAWIHKLHYLLGHAENMPPADRALALGWEPLYTTPPRREWRGLTKEDVAQNLQSRLDAAKLLEERRQEIAQPRREWQGLTEEEIDCWTPEIHSVIRAIEAALKEKNA
jgi:hypothetical protein